MNTPTGLDALNEGKHKQALTRQGAPVIAFKRKDLLWLLALPFYMLIGTTRHEFSHALTAMLEGARLVRIQLLPAISPEGGVLWGYAEWKGATTWLALAAPYFCDVLTFLLGFFFLRWTTKLPRWVRLQVFVVLVLSPAIDSLYNYLAISHHSSADVPRLATMIPHFWIGVWIVMSLAVYCLGIFALLKRHHP